MWTFIHDMKEDDLVVVPHGPKFYVGKITGPAFWDKSKVDEDTAYRRPVEWQNGKNAIPRDVAKSALISCMRTWRTTADANVSEIEDCLKRAESGETPSFGAELRDRLWEATLDEIQNGFMGNFGFERLIKSLLSSLGAVPEPEIVARSKDRGIDIYATFVVAGVFPCVVGVQAKHFQSKPPVEVAVIHQLIRGIEEGGKPVNLCLSAFVCTASAHGNRTLWARDCGCGRLRTEP